MTVPLSDTILRESVFISGLGSLRSLCSFAAIIRGPGVSQTAAYALRFAFAGFLAVAKAFKARVALPASESASKPR
jgi:hypothetical protein